MDAAWMCLSAPALVHAQLPPHHHPAPAHQHVALLGRVNGRLELIKDLPRPLDGDGADAGGSGPGLSVCSGRGSSSSSALVVRDVIDCYCGIFVFLGREGCSDGGSGSGDGGLVVCESRLCLDFPRC